MIYNEIRMEVLFHESSKHRYSGFDIDSYHCLNYFRSQKLPEIGKAAGQTLREFKNSANNIMSEEDKKKEIKEDNDEPEKDPSK